jgi:hypothetical protein
MKDAAAMRRALRAKGFSVSECCDNLGIQQMTNTIDNWTQGLQKDDVALFYYSGHGIRVDGTDYLMPTDFSPSYRQADVRFYAYSVDHLQDKMQERGTQTNVIILDACRDNPFLISKSLGKGLAGTAAGFGTFIMYAASPGKTASDNSVSDLSLFTGVLLQFLSGESVSLRALAVDVKDSVYELSQRMQVPYISENMVGDLQLGIAPESVDGTRDERLKADQVVRDRAVREEAARATASSSLPVGVTMEDFNNVPSLRFAVTYFCRYSVLFGQVDTCGKGGIFVNQQSVTFQGQGDCELGSACGTIEFSAARSNTVLKIEGGREGDTFSIYFNRKRYRFGPEKPDSPFVTLLRKAIQDYPAATQP